MLSGNNIMLYSYTASSTIAQMQKSYFLGYKLLLQHGSQEPDQYVVYYSQ